MLNFQTRQEQLVYGQVALVVAVSGSIDNKRVITQFERQLEDYFKIGYRFVVLDCAGIKFINSTGLQILLRMVEKYQQEGGIFLLIKVLPQISKFFDMVGFTPIFTFFTSKEEAVQYLITQIEKSEADSPSKEEPVSEAEPEEIASYGQPSFPVKGASSTPNAASFQQANAIQPASFPLPATPQAPPSPSYPANIPQPIPMVSNITAQPNIISQVPHPKGISTNVKQTYCDLESEMIVEGYKKARAFDIFPIRVTFNPMPGQKEKERQQEREGQVANIVVYCPGCIVTPEYRAVYLRSGTEVVFWVTPLVRKKVKGWLELWRGEESAQQYEIEFGIARQRGSWIFFLLSSFLFSWNWFANAHFFSCFPAFQEPIMKIVGNMRHFELAMAGSLLLLAVIFYFLDRPQKAKSTKHRVVFKES